METDVIVIESDSESDSESDVIDLTNKIEIPIDIYYTGIDPAPKNLGLAKWNHTKGKIAKSGKFQIIPDNTKKTYGNILECVSNFVKEQSSYFSCKEVAIEEQRFGFVNKSIQKAFCKVLGNKCKVVRARTVMAHFKPYFKRPANWKELTKPQRYSLKKKNSVKCARDIVGPIRVAYMSKKKDDELEAILLAKYLSDINKNVQSLN